MGKTSYYFFNMIKYWRKFITILRHSSEWHLSEITPDELFNHINSNLPLFIFDTRSSKEFNGTDGHIPNSMSIPIRKLSSNLKDPQSYIYDYKEKKIVTLCPGGGLSLIAVDILVEAGFEDVKSLHGGLDLWREKGFPTTTAEENLSFHEDIQLASFKENTVIIEEKLSKEYLGEVDTTVDARGLICPRPVLMSKKALKKLQIGQVLEILTTDPGSLADIPSWAHVTGQELISKEEHGPKDFRFVVKRMK